MGYGLSTILSIADEARIFSGNAFYYKNDKQNQFYETDFYLKGTLIYLNCNLSKLEIEEIVEEFNW